MWTTMGGGIGVVKKCFERIIGFLASIMDPRDISMIGGKQQIEEVVGC